MVTIRNAFLYIGFLALLFSTNVLAESGDGYRLSTGDVLSISVFDEPDLGVDEVKVPTTGVISFPLLGEVKVVNLTTRQVEHRLVTLLLEGYLKHPKVSVSIKEYRLFFVHGEVKSPGGYNYQNGLTVRKAVVLAGGFGERADKEKIILVSEDSPDDSSNVGLNHPVRPGDVITVEESFF